jgi:small-conductance mechanosensitive channel
MVMMLLIEFVNVQSSGRWLSKLQNRPWLQIIVAALLGLIPGCIGGFAVVSLFTHQMLSFGALVAGMITTFGDEAFVIFAYSPKWTLILVVCLLIIGIATGMIIMAIKKDGYFQHKALHSFDLHADNHEHEHFAPQLSYKNLKNISFQRAILLFGFLFFLFFIIISGHFGEENHLLPELSSSTHTQSSDNHSFERIIFFILALITLVMVAFSSEHFLQSHLWEHVIKRHFLTVFLWTLGVLLAIQLLYNFVDINSLITGHQWTMWLILLLAVVIGLIPESGPHLIFVVLFFSGAIPFSILLASSIVQDGHGALPLLAESRRSFFKMKGIAAAVGFTVGAIGLLAGF